MNVLIDSSEYFSNLYARKQIMDKYPQPQLADVLTEVYLMWVCREPSEEEYTICFPKYREACADLNLNPNLWMDDPFFTEIYHIVHQGKLTIQERMELLGDQYLFTNLYIVQPNELEPVVNYLVNVCKVFDCIGWNKLKDDYASGHKDALDNDSEGHVASVITFLGGRCRILGLMFPLGI